MSLISKWYSTTLAFGTDNQNTPEVDLWNSFEAIEIDIPTIEAAEVQIKGSNTPAGTFDLIAQEEPISSSTGGFRTTVPLGGKYRYIKVYLSAAQTADRVFAVRGISYASGGLVAVLDKIKAVETAIAALPAALPALRKANGTGQKVAESGKLYYVVWAGAGGGPEPRIRLADDTSTFFDMYSELKVCVVLAPAIPIPFSGHLTITSDARTVSIGYTLDSEE